MSGTSIRDRIVTTGRDVVNAADSLAQTALALSPWVPARGPHRMSDVDAGFLTKVFAKDAPGAIVEQAKDVGGTAGTTNRRRLSLTWNQTGRSAGLPEMVFVKGTPLSSKNRTMVAALDMAVHEVDFYRTARQELGDIVPISYFASAGVGARHLLVLQHLGDGYEHPPFKGERGVQHAEQMMLTFAKLHATFWESPRFGTDMRWAKPQTRRSGFAYLAYTQRRARVKILRSGEYELPPAARRLAEIFTKRQREVYKLFEKGPLTLIHGDCHFGNTYALADGRAGLLDWQVCFRGPHMRELSYFISSALTPEMRREHEESLVHLYLDALNEHNVKAPTFDEAWERYRFFFLEPWDANVITVLWPGMQAHHQVERTLGHANAAVVDHETDKVVERALERGYV